MTDTQKPIDLTKCEITSRGDTITVRTARGRLSYPNVFTAVAQTNEDGTSSKAKFSTSLVFPKTANLTGLKEAIELAAEAKFGKDYKTKYPKLRRPILNTAEYPKMGFLADEFPAFIRTSADPDYGYPEVVDHQPKVIKKEQAHEVYAGRWALLTVNVRAYDRAGNKGIGLYLNNVQVLEHGEKLSGSRAPAMSEFVAVPLSDSADKLFQ